MRNEVFLKMGALHTTKFDFEELPTEHGVKALKNQFEMRVSVDTEANKNIVVLQVTDKIYGISESNCETQVAKVLYQVLTNFSFEPDLANEERQKRLRNEGLNLLLNAARGHLYTLCKCVNLPHDVWLPAIDANTVNWEESQPE